MNNYDKATEFRSYDMALAAALIVNGHSAPILDRTQHNSRVSFVFERTEGVDEVIQRYWTGHLRVDPKAYFDAIKHLKTRIYSE